MKKKEFTEAGALYFIATLFNKGIGFITVPIFSRILSTSDYGTVTTFNSWVSMISVVMSLALYMSIRASFIDYSEKERPRYLSTILSFTCIIFAISMAGALAVSYFVPKSITMALVYLCFIQSFGNALINDYGYYLMMKYQYKTRTALMILPSLASIILSIIAILFIVKENLYMGRIVPTTVVYAITAVIILCVVFSKYRPNLNLNYLKYGLTLSLPLVLHSIALHILSQSDRVMITWLRDTSETGIYSLVYNLGMISTVITTSLDGIWVPWFTEKLRDGKRTDINTLVMDYVNLMTYAMVALILAGPEILKIFADSRYWVGISIIPPIVLANYLIFMYTLYVNTEHFHKKTTSITKNTIIAAVINLVLNYIFIPKFGYVAAAYTTLFSYLMAFILHSRYAKKIEPDLYPLKMFIRPLVHIGVVIVLYYPTIDFWMIRWSVMVLYVALMLVRERFRLGELVPGLAARCSFFRR